VDGEVLGVLEAAVTQLASAGARIDTAARPVDLADSNALFVNLLMAAVSPGVPDWNQTNERRQQLRARWQAFFQSFDVLLTPVSPVAAIVHDHTGDVFSRTITVNGTERPYVEQGVWTGLAGVAYLPAAVAPIGRTTGGLPVGVQVIAPYLEDRTAIDVARHIERHIGGFVAPPITS
jgi:amidase